MPETARLQKIPQAPDESKDKNLARLAFFVSGVAFRDKLAL